MHVRPNLIIALALAIILTGGIAPAASASQAAPAASSPACAELLGIGDANAACLMVVHAVPDGPDVDVRVAGKRVADRLAFGEVSGYLAVPSGRTLIEIVPAGAGEAAVVLDRTVLQPGRAYELALLGELASLTTRIDAVDLTPLPPPTADLPLADTRVRVVHAVPDAPPVTIRLIADDIAFDAVRGLAFGEASDDVVLRAGIYRAFVSIDGLPLPDIDLGEVTFPGDVVTSIYAIGTAASGNIQVLPITVDLASGEATSRTTAPEITPVSGLVAEIHLGTCAEPTGIVAWELERHGRAMTIEPPDPAATLQGSETALPVWSGRGVADDATFDQLLRRAIYALVITDLSTGQVIACGDIGGVVDEGRGFWDGDSLLLGLAPAEGSDWRGIASLVEARGVLTNRVIVTIALLPE